MLVDDQEMFVDAVRALLAGDDRIEVVASAGSGARALELAEALTPDVALVDLALPRMDGYETTRRLLAAQPALRVIVVSGMSGEGVADRATSAGASGFLFKGGLFREIAEAILGSGEPGQAFA
jgi:DNA-binding NarL/FixJ family response regulator